MTDQELAAIVQALRDVGTDRRAVEVKRAHRALPERLWETLSAFSNTPGGGILLLGLEESAGFAVSGVEDPARIQSDLASLCDRMEPPVRAVIEMRAFEGRWVVAAEVPEAPSDQKPCFYRGAGPINGSFIRVADGNRRLTEYEVHLFWESHRPPRYDRQPVAGKTLNDLDPVRLKAFLDRVRRRSRFREWEDARILETLKVAVPALGGELVPTVAGYLALGRYPQEEWPGLHLSVVRYPTIQPGAPGPRGERLVDSVKVEGNLPEMVMGALEAILRNLRTSVVVRGLFREDLLEYPLEFLREVVVNALAHRDYSPQAQGAPVQVRLFPDRLEVENAGGLYGPVTEDRLGEPGLMAARNEVLVRLLEDLPLEEGRMMCENRGTGIVSMLEALRNSGLAPARFDDRRTTFHVSVSNAALLDQATLDWLNRLARTVPLSETQRVALAYCKREGSLSHTQYRYLSPHLDSTLVTRELTDLVDRGLLLRHGVRRWTTYTLPGGEIETFPTSSTTRSRRDRREQIVSLLAPGLTLSAAEIAQTLDLSPPAVRRWMKVLRDEGKVEITKPHPKSPGVRYRISRSEE